MSVFHIELRQFDRNLRAWPATFLQIPSAEVLKLFDGGTELESRAYTVDKSAQLVRWNGDGDRPASPLAEVRVTAKLTSMNVPIVVALIGAAATVLATLISSASPAAEASRATQPPWVAPCRDDLSRLRTLVDATDDVSAIEHGAINVLKNCKTGLDSLEENP